MVTLDQQKLNLAEKSNSEITDSQKPNNIKIVAEGDSWFNYPLVLDVIDHLRKFGYLIHKVSTPGDTIENMVYGTKYSIIKRKNIVENMGPVDLNETIASISSFNPRFVLFSAGGNDIVGEDLIQYINHKDFSRDPLKLKLFKNNLKNFIKPSILKFCDKVWKADSSIDIIMDGYDYAKPNGKSYFRIKGPWLLPIFGKKAITDRKEQDKIIKEMVDRFNELLREIQKRNSKFHHIDLRGKFPDDDQWHNEIHLKKEGYESVAKDYHQKIIGILGYDPL